MCKWPFISMQRFASATTAISTSTVAMSSVTLLRGGIFIVRLKKDLALAAGLQRVEILRNARTAACKSKRVCSGAQEVPFACFPGFGNL